MKYLILLAGILFCLYRIIQGLKDREEQRRIIEAEKQREADAARLRQEWREEQEKKNRAFAMELYNACAAHKKERGED